MEVFAAMMFFSIPLVAIVLGHNRKMEQMRQGPGGSSEVTEQLKQMSAQIAELRDTTTRYDMSFDTALQRLETRMTQLEQSRTAETANVQRN